MTVARLPVAALLVGLSGAAVFAAVLAGAGDAFEGRELGVVAPWALPGLLLGTAAAGTALAALRTPRLRAAAVCGALLVALSLVALVLVNPAIAPPVP